MFNVHKQTLICIRDGQNILVLSDTILTEKQKSRLLYPYAMAKGVRYYKFEVLKENELRILNDKTIAIVGNSSLKGNISGFQVDYLILRNNANGYEKLAQEFKGKALIRDASNYPKKYMKSSDDLNTRIWDTRIKGSFCIPLSVD